MNNLQKHEVVELINKISKELELEVNKLTEEISLFSALDSAYKIINLSRENKIENPSGVVERALNDGFDFQLEKAWSIRNSLAAKAQEILKPINGNKVGIINLKDFYFHFTHQVNLESIMQWNLLSKDKLLNKKISSKEPSSWMPSILTWKKLTSSNAEYTKEEKESQFVYSEQSVRFSIIGNKTYDHWMTKDINATNAFNFIAFIVSKFDIDKNKENWNVYFNDENKDCYFIGTFDIKKPEVQNIILVPNLKQLPQNFIDKWKLWARQNNKTVYIAEVDEIKKANAMSIDPKKELFCRCFIIGNK